MTSVRNRIRLTPWLDPAHYAIKNPQLAENHWHWSIPRLHYHGVRRGGFIFTGGQADLNQLGEVVNPRTLTRQTQNVIDHVEAIITAAVSGHAKKRHEAIRYEWLEGHWNWTPSLSYQHTNNFRGVLHLGGQVALDEQTHVLYPAPATSGIPAPHLVYESMMIEIEVIAIVEPWEPHANSSAPEIPNEFSHSPLIKTYLIAG